MKKYVKNFLSKKGIHLVNSETLEKFKRYKPLADEFTFMSLYPQSASEYLKYRSRTKAQLKQDLFVLMHHNFKRNGYFVEFGATDGESLSNTHLLEKDFNWSGILAEPAQIWHPNLTENRNCNIETSCVWSATGKELRFKEVSFSSLSTVYGYGKNDSLSKSRNIGKTYTVKTISLHDLLLKYDAPKNIDYLSVDTEGSEFLILNNFDFSQYSIEIITVEHNFTPIREKIFKLLMSKGYKRVYQEFSQFDDWYVLHEI